MPTDATCSSSGADSGVTIQNQRGNEDINEELVGCNKNEKDENAQQRLPVLPMSSEKHPKVKCVVCQNLISIKI